jgi:hypothetical protein
VVIRLTRNQEEIQRLVNEAETQKTLSFESIYLFSLLSRWLIENCDKNKIPFSINNDLRLFYQKASSVLDRQEEETNYISSVTTSSQYYKKLENEVTELHMLIFELMFSFKSQLLWFLHCCDTNHIKIENLDYVSSLINQSERIRHRLERQLLSSNKSTPTRNQHDFKHGDDSTEPNFLLLFYYKAHYFRVSHAIVPCSNS